MIHNVEEGRLYLEEALLDLGEQLNLDALAGTLVQVSMMEDTPALVSHTVRVVVLILAQMNRAQEVRQRGGCRFHLSRQCSRIEARGPSKGHAGGGSTSGNQVAKQHDGGRSGTPSTNGGHGRENTAGPMCSGPGD